MSGPKRNPDKLNSIGIVVVGICGAVLVYVSIIALQAFYIDDTSDVQTMADYGGQETTFLSIRAQQTETLKSYRPNTMPPPAPGQAAREQTYVIPVDQAIRLVVESAKQDPAVLVPAIGKPDKPTVKEIYGRPVLLPAPGAAAGSAAPTGAPAAPDGAGAGSGSAAPDAGSAAPQTPTAGQGPGGGAPPGAEAPGPSARGTGTPASTHPPASRPGGQPVKDAGGGAASPQPAKEPAGEPKKGNAS